MIATLHLFFEQAHMLHVGKEAMGITIIQNSEHVYMSVYIISCLYRYNIRSNLKNTFVVINNF